MDFCAQNRFNCGFRNPRTFPETRLRGMLEGSATGLRAAITKGVMDDEGAAQAREWF